MRYICKILILATGILFIGCYSGEDYNNLIVLRIQDAITIENSESYVVGDTIFFELNFSRYLPEEGYSNLLDIYESTDATGFDYSFDLRKSSSLSNDFVSVAIDASFIFAEKGAVFESFNEATATLNEDENIYESRVGIILAEAGDFRFDFDYIYLHNQYVPDKVYLEIQHEFSQNSSVIFDFTVTE